ncbi:hypothetical protein DICPUDRAFT_33881 [Dictyostelium purpureum]|uniref:L-2-hydroxyglutarate dehydrogenase, mitochondrial n=1 Tax=Dictyostelium purpureum TaxID=5786 RepID=F0ZLQ4_DICPU|nr:uncharacterized protein DICPUDRAFT_33881 [Dictyostelium purpureum]EGC35138.1 hypothetical protein DICPUDRAFT_33881 [Dictyostelium purpureum]|eukprot:XP_003288331.1 hypothetical protein DICPUDRAFT_33881 [Dictyostelium purpureum]
MNRFTSLLNKKIYDVTIVGSGIVGIATAREILKRNPTLKLLILEKEDSIARHQSSHNSGVIHCGVYYKPGSTKARLCVKGSKMMYDYCKENDIKHENCGKIIVAVKKSEFDSLEALYKRGIENGVPNIEMVDRDRLLNLEPSITGGLKAIYTPTTGIVNYLDVAKSMAKEIQDKYQAEVQLGFEASIFDYDTKDKLMYIGDKNNERSILTRHVITCAGMYSDRVAHNAFGQKEPSIVPFRGSFLQFKPEYKHLIKGNVYPIPNPSFPFLGVHFTKKIDGNVWLGPNAVLAFSREGYSYKDFRAKDFQEILTNPGLFALSLKHWKYGVNELLRDIYPSNFIELLQPYMPDISMDMLEVTDGASGVRSQAISPNGDLIEDFIFDTPKDKPILHVRNSPSPAATSSLAIAEEIANMAQNQFKELNNTKKYY